MAQVTVKLFGSLRLDAHISEKEMDAESLDQVLDRLGISFQEAVVYVNGQRTWKKRCRLKDGEEIWLMSPASGG